MLNAAEIIRCGIERNNRNAEASKWVFPKLIPVTVFPTTDPCVVPILIPKSCRRFTLKMLLHSWTVPLFYTTFPSLNFQIYDSKGIKFVYTDSKNEEAARGAYAHLFSTPGQLSDYDHSTQNSYKGGLSFNEEFPGNSYLYIKIYGIDVAGGSPNQINLLLVGQGISSNAMLPPGGI